jgi:hypothetical protein
METHPVKRYGLDMNMSTQFSELAGTGRGAAVLAFLDEETRS